MQRDVSYKVITLIVFTSFGSYLSVNAQTRPAERDEKLIARYLVDSSEIFSDVLKTGNYSGSFYSEEIVRKGATRIVKAKGYGSHGDWYLYMRSEDSVTFLRCQDFIRDWGQIRYYLKKISNEVPLEVITNSVLLSSKRTGPIPELAEVRHGNM